MDSSFPYLERASGKPRLLGYEHHSLWGQIWGAERNGGNSCQKGYHGEPKLKIRKSSRKGRVRTENTYVNEGNSLGIKWVSKPQQSTNEEDWERKTAMISVKAENVRVSWDQGLCYLMGQPQAQLDLRHSSRIRVGNKLALQFS